MADDQVDERPAGSRRLVLVLAIALVVGVLGGFVAGGAVAGNLTERDEDAADRASEQEDDLRDRRTLLDARVELVEQQTKPLGEVVTKGPLLATAKSTANVEPGQPFSVDGGDYLLRSVQVVDSFESQTPERPADERDGHRWLLAELDYTNRTREEQAPACGTMGVVRAVLADGTTVKEYDYEPPVHPDTYDQCGRNLPPGKGGRWFAPVLVPEGETISGILVADVYARSSGTEFRVRAGKAAWIRLDEPIEVGEVGDDAVERSFVSDDEKGDS